MEALRKMEIARDSLDDVLMSLYKALPDEGKQNCGTRGNTREILGVTLRIANPRARLSRSEDRGKLFSALGELLWYFSTENHLSFIEPYIPAYKKEAEDDGTIYGGYGPRLFKMRADIDQITNVRERLKCNPGTRRAVIQLFNAEDIVGVHKEVPCTTTIQFFIRREKLHAAVTLRSNDAYKGLPHDVFCFTMLQEMMACSLGVDLGEYVHFVGSMHVYAENLDNLDRYTQEGYHKLTEMPAMPRGDAFLQISTLRECEKRIRAGEIFPASSAFQDPYWADLARLLQAFWARGAKDRLDQLAAELKFPLYQPYLETRRKRNCQHQKQ